MINKVNMHVNRNSVNRKTTTRWHTLLRPHSLVNTMRSNKNVDLIKE